MPGTIRLGALLALLAVAVALPGCGSDEISGEIPQTNADDLNSALASVRAEIEAGCPDPEQARERAQAFVDEVNLLPEDPSAELKPELQEAGENLRALVDSECDSTESPPTTPTTSSTAPTTTPTTSSTKDTTTTDTTTTTTDTTNTTDETPPPGNGNGGGPPGDGGTGGTGGPGGGADE